MSSNTALQVARNDGLDGTWDSEVMRFDHAKSRVRTWLDDDRPRLEVADYMDLCPASPVISEQRWSADNERQLQEEWATNPRREYILQYNYKGGPASELKALWKLFPRIWHKLPTDLLSPKLGLRFDDTKNQFVKDGQGNDFRNPIWSSSFCETFKVFALHPFWEYSAELEFPLMAMLLRYAIMCRTSDCRKWTYVENTTTDIFLDRFIEARNSSMTENWELAKVHAKVLVDLAGRKQSRWSKAFKTIEAACTSKTNNVKPQCGPPPPIYNLISSDIKNATYGLYAAMEDGNKYCFSPTHWLSTLFKIRGYGKDDPPSADQLGQVYASGYLANLRLERMVSVHPQEEVFPPFASLIRRQGLWLKIYGPIPYHRGLSGPFQVSIPAGYNHLVTKEVLNAVNEGLERGLIMAYQPEDPASLGQGGTLAIATTKDLEEKEEAFSFKYENAMAALEVWAVALANWRYFDLEKGRGLENALKANAQHRSTFIKHGRGCCKCPEKA